MRKIYLIAIMFFCAFAADAQVRGIVMSGDGTPVPGAYVYDVNDPQIHTVSEADGSFYLAVSDGDVISVGTSGMEFRYEVSGDEQTFVLDDVAAKVHTGFTSSNALNYTQAVSTIYSDDIAKSNSNNIWQSMYGTLPGLTVVQQLGWDVKPTLYVRGGATLTSRNPLVVVDGFVRDADNLSADEVESISVLKDGAATALYGTQGANGVIVITTKRGEYKSMDVDVDYKFGLGIPYDMPEFVDAATYATALNEALQNDGLPQRYTDREIAAFASGEYNDLYPNVDWMEEGLRDFTTNHQVGLTFSGGGSNVRYYTHIDYQNDMGLLRNTGINDKYSTQMRKNKLSARVNLDINLTKSTTVAINLLGLLSEYHRPAGDGSNVSKFYKIPSSAFPVKTADGKWGGSDNWSYNPIADVVDVGYFNAYTRQLQSDIRLRQDFSFWVKGLSAEVAIAYDNSASFQEGNKKTYAYEVKVPLMDNETGEILQVATNVFGEDKSLEYWSNLSSQRIDSALEARIAYDRTFGRHSVSATALYRQESSMPMGRNSTRKYQNVMAIGRYSYADRYFVDVVANYHGASVMLKGNRFTFYPAVSAAWVISNEGFLSGAAWLDMLKLRASYGRSGFTGFGYELDRKYYVDGNSYYFTSSNTVAQGMKEGSLPVSSLKSQISDRFNFGVDFSVFSSLDFTADAYYEKRSRILLPTSSVYSSVLGITSAQTCTGAVDAKGFETSLKYRGKSGDFRYEAGATFSFSRTSILQNNEGNVSEPYLSKKGTRIGQFFGLEYLGFFRDQEDIDNSYQQAFSAVRPGDIKYKDQNGDKVIDADDMVPIGYSTIMPEIYYGIDLGFEWRGLGLNLQFQGTGNYSAVLATAGIYRPMASNANLSEWYWSENVRWTPETRDYANLPRLTTQANPNNTQNSSFWLADASYFTLRNAWLYYNLPQRWFSRMKISMFQIYLKGENLFRLDKIKYSNPDHVGALYPDMMVLYAGLNIKF